MCIEFICAVFWKIWRVLVEIGGCILAPFELVFDGFIINGKALIDEYRNRKNETEG